MTKFLAVAGLLFAACSDTAPTATATSTTSAESQAPPASTPVAAGLTGGPGEPTVDPTMPSWAPKTCITYHKVVVEALGCIAIARTKRDEIQRAYGVASRGWKAETDGTPTKIQQVSDACELSTLSVHTDASGKKCALSKS